MSYSRQQSADNWAEIVARIQRNVAPGRPISNAARGRG